MLPPLPSVTMETEPYIKMNSFGLFLLIKVYRTENYEEKIRRLCVATEI